MSYQVIQQNKTGRIEYLDFLKGIAIMAVIIGHLAPKGSVPFKLCYSFNMPLFIIISGFLTEMSLINKGNIITNETDYLIKRIRRILVPHICWCSIYIISSVTPLSTYCFIDQIFINPILWFLLNLFLYDLIFLIALNRKNSIRMVIYLISFIIIGIAYYLTKYEVFKNYVLFFPFFILGNIIPHLKTNKFHKVIYLSLFLYPLSLFFYTYGDQNVADIAGSISSSPLGYKLSFGIIWLNSHFIVPIFGIAFYFIIAKWITKLRAKSARGISKVITYIGQYTLQIYVMHYMLIFYKSDNIFFYVIVNFIISLSLCLIIARIVKRIKPINEVLFGFIPKKTMKL